jgi:hypothetical protein
LRLGRWPAEPRTDLAEHVQVRVATCATNGSATPGYPGGAGTPSGLGGGHTHTLLIFTATPGSDSHDKLALLAVLGAQALTPDRTGPARTGPIRTEPALA